MYVGFTAVLGIGDVCAARAENIQQSGTTILHGSVPGGVDVNGIKRGLAKRCTLSFTRGIAVYSGA